MRQATYTVSGGQAATAGPWRSYNTVQPSPDMPTAQVIYPKLRGLLTNGTWGVLGANVIFHLASITLFGFAIAEQKKIVGDSYLQSVEHLSWAGFAAFAAAIVILLTHTITVYDKVQYESLTSTVIAGIGLAAFLLAGLAQFVIFVLSFRTSGAVDGDQALLYASLACYFVAAGLLIMNISCMHFS